MSNLEFLTPTATPAPTNPAQSAVFSPLTADPATPDYSPPLLAQLGIGSTDQPRLLPNLPQAIHQFQSKYQRFAPLLSQLPDSTRNAIIQYDSSRVAAGACPLGDAETIGAIKTSLTGQPATPPPARKPLNILGNAKSDLQSIIGSVPHIVPGLIHEAQQLPHISDYISQAEAKGMNPLSALLTAPGIRLIPGTYVGGQLAQGHFNELLTHPLFTGLDLLPVADKLAEGTAVVRAAEEAALESGARVRPLATALTRRLTPEGEVVPNVLSQVGTDIMRSTRPGQKLEEFFGRTNRDISYRLRTSAANIENQMAGITSNPDELTQLVSRGVGLQAKHAIPDSRQAALAELVTTGDTALHSELAPNELSYVNEFRDVVHELGLQTVAQGHNLGQFTDDLGRSEFYPSEVHGRLEAARNARNLATQNASLAREIMSPTADPNSYLQSALDATRAPRVPAEIGAGTTTGQRAVAMAQTGQRTFDDIRLTVRGNLKALDAAGYDVSELERAQTLAHSSHDWSVMSDALERAMSEPLRPRPIMSLPDIMSTIRPFMRSDRLVYSLGHAIQDARWTRVTSILDAIQARYGYSVIPELQDPFFIDSLRRQRNTSRFLETHFSDSERAATRASAAYEAAQNAAVPARYGPLILAQTQQRLVRTATEMAHATSPEAVASITSAVLHDAWRDLPEADWPAIYHSTIQDVASGWRDLRDSGLDPPFVHALNPSKAYVLGNQTVGEVPTSLSQIKERVLDATPGIKNLHIAISDMGRELLSRRASEENAAYIASLGTPIAQLADAYRPAAIELMRAQPEYSYRTALQQVMRKQFTKFDPADAGYNWGGPLLDHIDQQDIMIPNAWAKNLKRMHDPKSVLGGVMDPVTKLFRMSVIALSPRTQFYNILGGAVMAGAEAGPGMFKYAGEAWNMVRHSETIENAELQTLIGQQAALFKDLDAHAKTGVAEGITQYAWGKTMKRWWDDSQLARKTVGVRDVLGRISQKSYDLNGVIDDWYRAMAYLSGKDKALVRGMSQEAAERAGIELTRKALMDWGSMTSMEHSIMKSIFPFYGFMRFAIGYVLRYPFDHPLRVEIMSKLAASEMADNNDVLPNRFLGLLGIGSPNPHTGKQTFLNIAPINPFNDVANMMTVQGFVGATNPIINATLQSLGIDRGQVDLYPSLRYDAESGRLTATHPNILLAGLSATIPQSDIITSLLGFNTQFSDTLHRDPAAAIRSLATAGGLPIPWRQYNVPLEQMRAEVARQTAATNVKQQALSTGNWTNALRYPSLRDTFARVANLPPDVLTLYQANSARPQTLAQMIQQIPVGPGTGATDA